MRITPAQRKFLNEAADNHLGVVKLFWTTGFGRRSQRRMARRLCEAGLVRRYIPDADEFEITDKGRAALGEVK